MGNVGGYIKLHRQLLNWEWWDNANMTRIWIYFLLKANYQDSTWHGITIPRGSFITSLDAICKDTGLSVREIRTCLNRLKSTGELTIKTTNRYTMVTISKYDVYNSLEDKSDKQNDTPQDKQETNKRQTKDKRTTTDKNNKEYKEKKEEEKNEETILSERFPFADWWRNYDKKINKSDCEKKWEKLSDADKAAIMEHTPKYVASTPEKQYRKNPLSYLNEKSWKDEIIRRTQGNGMMYGQILTKEMVQNINDAEEW